jgi:acylphosphatase
MKRVRFIVSGNVHGVNFRYSSAKKAKELNLTGFVRNSTEGVEVILEGKENAIEQFIEFCRGNPGYSEVMGIEIKEKEKISRLSFKDFQISY